MANVINIESIKMGLPGISPVWAATLVEACIVCLARQNHSPGTEMLVNDNLKEQFSLNWTDLYSDQLDRTWKDQEEATELGAVCLAVQLALEMTDYTVIERSAKTTGFDYWLGDATDDELIFEKKARLEISGIFNGDFRSVNTRYRVKVKQTKQSDDSGLPAYIAVIEFSKPMAKFGDRK